MLEFLRHTHVSGDLLVRSGAAARGNGCVGKSDCQDIEAQLRLHGITALEMEYAAGCTGKLAAVLLYGVDYHDSYRDRSGLMRSGRICKAGWHGAGVKHTRSCRYSAGTANADTRHAE